MSNSLQSQDLHHTKSSLSFTISQSLLKLMIIKSVMPCNHVILCHPLLILPSIFPSIRVFPNESVLCIRWPKYWSFSFNISPSNEHSGLISFRTGLISLLSKRVSRVFSNTTVWNHQFFSTQPSLWSDCHIHTGLLEKTIAFTGWTFVVKVMPLLFTTLSSFVIAFLPRSIQL